MLRGGFALALLVVAAGGCPGQRASEAGAGDSAQVEVVRRLVRELRPAERQGDFVVVIDHEALAELERRDRLPAGLREPLAAARLFSPTLAIPSGSELRLVEESRQPGEGSGLFHATVEMASPDGLVTLRMVSEPSAGGEPSIWLPNDLSATSRVAR